jgi:hypothetical protein
MKYIGFTLKIPLGVGKVKIELLSNKFRVSLARKISREYGMEKYYLYHRCSGFIG